MASIFSRNATSNARGNSSGSSNQDRHEVKAHLIGGRLDLQPLLRAHGVRWAASDHADACRPRRGLLENLEALGREIRRNDREARHVASRSRQARDQPLANGVPAAGHDDGYGLRGVLQGQGGSSGNRDNDVRLEADELGGEFRHLFGACGTPRLQDDVATLDILELAETLDERLQGAGPFGHQHADPPDRLGLLRLGSDRPPEKGEAEEKC